MNSDKLQTILRALEDAVAQHVTNGASPALIEAGQQAILDLKEEIKMASNDLTVVYMAGFKDGKKVAEQDMRDGHLFRKWVNSYQSAQPKAALGIIHCNTINEAREFVTKLEVVSS